MEYFKTQDESLKEYFNRICKNKSIYNLTWDNIAELMNKESGKNYKESTYRKKWTNYLEGFEDGVKNTLNEDEVLKEYELSFAKIQEEKVKLRDNRVALNRQIRAKARFENITEELISSMQRSLEPLKVCPPKNNNSEQILVAAFSDFHVGAEFKNSFGEYSIEIFKERLAEYVGKIIAIGKKEDISNIKVLSLGDVISGIIHVSTRLENAENVIRQVQIASEYISQALCELAKNFANVEYFTAIGNHGRVSSSKEESLYNENFEKLVPWYISARTNNIKNIHIMENDIDDGIIVVDIFDNLIFGVHGDKDSFVRAANVLPAMLKRFPLSIWSGHLHSFGVETVHDVEVIRSGSLGGTDEFAKNKRLTGRPCQTIGIYDKKGLVSLHNIKF